MNQLRFVLALAAVALCSAAAPKLLWTANLSPSIFSARPVIVNSDGIFAATMNLQAVSLAPKTGSALWTTATGLDAGSLSPSSSPGRVFFGASGTMIGVNSSNGNLLWTAKPQSWSSIVWNLASMPVISGYVVNTYVINGASMMAVDINTGNTAWIQNFSSNGISAPTGLGKTAFAMLSGSIVAVDVTSGNILWTCSTNCCAQAMGGGALAYGSTLYFGGSGPTLSALDITTQTCLWTTPLAVNGGVWPRDILITNAGGTVVVGESGGVAGMYGINALTGAVSWSRTDLPPCQGESAYCHPDMSSNDVVYYPSGAQILGLEAATGHVVANFSVPSTIFGTPSTGQSLLVVSTQSAVYAYQESSGAVVNNCATASCAVCVKNTLQLGCAKIKTGGSLYRACTLSGLEVTAFTTADCTGTPVTSDQYNTGVCYPTPFGTSFEVVSCPVS